MHAIFILCRAERKAAFETVSARSLLSAGAFPPLGRCFATDGRYFAGKFEALRVGERDAKLGRRGRWGAHRRWGPSRSHRGGLSWGLSAEKRHRSASPAL